jgi:O-antigen/teichoic acid export membrane protein
VNTPIKQFIHKIFYSISANLVILFVSILFSFILPKFLGQEDYGYWQLYMFYLTYVGCFHLGWSDGIILRYGGAYYNELNKSLMHSQYWLLSVLEIFVCLGFFLFSLFFVNDVDKTFILTVIGINCILLLPRLFLLAILQRTG